MPREKFRHFIKNPLSWETGGKMKKNCFRTRRIWQIMPYILFAFDVFYLFSHNFCSSLRIVYSRHKEHTIQVAILNQFSWNSQSRCGSTHGRTLSFLETIGLIEPLAWGKMYLQNQFSRFHSAGLEVFKKNFPQKFPCPPKIIFRCYFGKYCFFPKKIWIKNFENLISKKKKKSPSPQNVYILPQMIFTVFSKNTAFSKNLFNIKISGT